MNLESGASSSPPFIGIFEGHADVGSVKRPGWVDYDVAQRTYTVAGSGANMWDGADEFQFVWKRVTGDVSLEADMAFLGDGIHAHRKACLVVRQSLEPDSNYADIALHGDGLTSLQFREATGANTNEVRTNVTGARRARIERRGRYVAVSLAKAGEAMKSSGACVALQLDEPYYIGLGVCSHDPDVLEKAVFSNVEWMELDVLRERALLSSLETIDVVSRDRQIVHAALDHFEAPNWSPDGKWLVFNGGGRLLRIPPTGGKPEYIDSGFAIRCNNDHGISPDGTMIVVSDHSLPPHESVIYTFPISGGTPTRITEHYPSYWHGWSPDGKTLAYCARRDGKFGVFTIPASGGEETRLTTTEGLDDGPEYSPDGRYIYFNSDRTGLMQIWRMAPDGSNLEQITHDDANNWFAHLSPDGKFMAFLTYEKDVEGHPANKDVAIRLMNLADGTVTALVKLFGGQGTLNVPSWSPDGRRLAFVSYQLG